MSVLLLVKYAHPYMCVIIDMYMALYIWPLYSFDMFVYVFIYMMKAMNEFINLYLKSCSTSTYINYYAYIQVTSL